MIAVRIRFRLREPRRHIYTPVGGRKCVNETDQPLDNNWGKHDIDDEIEYDMKIDDDIDDGEDE
jgi:hypothetical protein